MFFGTNAYVDTVERINSISSERIPRPTDSLRDSVVVDVVKALTNVKAPVDASPVEWPDQY
jgi:hypothetical protein